LDYGSRVDIATTERVAGWTKSSDQRALTLASTRIGVRVPIALRQALLANCQPLLAIDREPANRRRRFGYRRLLILLREQGEASDINRIYRAGSARTPPRTAPALMSSREATSRFTSVLSAN
jgi:hypothetical protein